MNEQTTEICPVVVKQNGKALQFVRKQTPELYMIAVQQSGYALNYVRELTPELCAMVIRKYGSISDFINNPKTYVEVSKYISLPKIPTMSIF